MGHLVGRQGLHSSPHGQHMWRVEQCSCGIGQRITHPTDAARTVPTDTAVAVAVAVPYLHMEQRLS